MLVGSITSRNLSEALSCSLRMAVAVSKKAMPLSLQKSIISLILNRLCAKSIK